MCDFFDDFLGICFTLFDAGSTALEAGILFNLTLGLIFGRISNPIESTPRTPSYPNGWKNSRNNSDDGGKIPLMTLNNHFQDDFDDDDIDDNDDGLDDEVVINGAVNGGRHSFT